MRVSKCVEVDVDFDVEVTDFVEDMDADEIIEALSEMDLTQNQRAELTKSADAECLTAIRWYGATLLNWWTDGKAIDIHIRLRCNTRTSLHYVPPFK